MPQVLKLKQGADEPASALRNHHAVWLCNALQARRKVRRLANDGLLLDAPEPTRSPTTTNPVAMPTRVCSLPPTDPTIQFSRDRSPESCGRFAFRRSSGRLVRCRVHGREPRERSRRRG